MKPRLQKKIKQKGTENVKHYSVRFKELLKSYHDINEDRLKMYGQEFVQRKRAMKAESRIKELEAELEALRNQPELLFPRLTD